MYEIEGKTLIILPGPAPYAWLYSFFFSFQNDQSVQVNVSQNEHPILDRKNSAIAAREEKQLKVEASA